MKYFNWLFLFLLAGAAQAQLPIFTEVEAAQALRLRANLDTAQGVARVTLLNKLAPLEPDFAQAARYAEEARQLAQSLGYREGEAVAHLRLGDALRWTRHLVTPADSSLAELAARYQATAAEVAQVNHLLAGTIFVGQQLYIENRGRRAEILAHYQRALVLRQQIGQPDGEAWAWRKLGDFHLSLADTTQAEQCYQSWLAVRQREGDPQKQAWALDFLQHYYQRTGKLAALAQVVAARLALMAPAQKAANQGAIAQMWATLDQPERAEAHFAAAYAAAADAATAHQLATNWLWFYRGQLAGAANWPEANLWLGRWRTLVARHPAWPADPATQLATLAAHYERHGLPEIALFWQAQLLRHRLAQPDTSRVKQAQYALRNAGERSWAQVGAGALAIPRLAPGQTEYQVAAGQSLAGVAAAAGTDLATFLQFNNLPADLRTLARPLTLNLPPWYAGASGLPRARWQPTPPELATLADTLLAWAKTWRARELAAPTPGLRGSAAVAGQVAAFLLARAAQPEAAAQRLTELAADRWGSCQACPSAVAYQNQAAEVYLAAQQPAKALAFYQKGLQMLAADRQDARPALAQYLRMAQLHQNQRDTAALLRLYIDLEKFCEARVYPLPAPAALGLAEHYQQRNQRTLAIAYARKALLTADLDLLPGLPAQVNTEPPPSEQATEEEGEEEATTDGPANPSPAKSSVEQPTNPVAKRAVALLRLLTQVDTARPEDFREFVIHTVGPDETLDQIMELYQVSRACLEEWNFIENNYPLPGQQLRVCRRATWDLPVNPAKPPEANASRQHRTRSGDRWETLAREYQTTVPQLLAWNPRLKPGPLPVGENLKVGEYFTPCGCGK